jgi:hypothetical protein
VRIPSSRAARDHRSCAGAGSTTHPGGNEHHVAADEMSLDIGHRLLGGGSANFRLGACAKAFRDVGAHLDAPLALRAR